MGLEKFLNMSCDAQWYKDLRDLVTGTSDRAVRHVRVCFERQDLDAFNLPESNWKPARRAICEPALEAATANADALARPQDEQMCIICREACDTVNRLRSLACHDQHLVCMDCLMEIFHSEGPDLKCPLCRVRILADEEQNQALKFGTVGKAYEPDPRFSHLENFERSCPDLDQHLASNNTHRMQVQGALAYNLFWFTFIQEARNEPPQSTPIHLQSARRIECEMLSVAAQRAFQSATLVNHNMENGRICDAYAMLMSEIHRSFLLYYDKTLFVMELPRFGEQYRRCFQTTFTHSSSVR